MSLHAIDDISDAIDATKSFLLPFAARTWLKLAVVVFFISGGGGGLNIPQNSGNFGGQDQPAGGGTEQFFEGVPSTLHGVVAEYGTELAIIVGLALTLVLLFALLSNFMEFVFVESLIEREVHVRQYLVANVGNSLRLFGFRLVVALVSLTLVVGFLYTIFLTVLGGSLNNIGPGALLGLFPVFIIFFLGIGLVQGLLTGFTNVFVVPMMLTSSRGVLGSWKRLLGSMRRNIKQYLGYLAFSIVLGIGVGIVGGLLGLVATLLLAIPFVLLGAAVFFGLGGGQVALALTAVVGVLFALFLLLATNLIQVPLQAFMRYYAMLVLGDIDAELDPIPEVREDIRVDEPDAGAAPSEGI
ncbi:DUF7544 domain-containing protein [Haloarcula salinisoli]|uniref:Uncharacterized protein n=1 Tax=Haloarcula salinisoli TaxID=2487746 RepID=A0A8J7YNX1_9EURY|nr:hypothetical protein [Halomicroarcula salinisoli]MBX0305241.1 hypothetical protein [Halomicroarcula salinisoli]